MDGWLVVLVLQYCEGQERRIQVPLDHATAVAQHVPTLVERLLRADFGGVVVLRELQARRVELEN